MKQLVDMQLITIKLLNEKWPFKGAFWQRYHRLMKHGFIVPILYSESSHTRTDNETSGENHDIRYLKLYELWYKHNMWLTHFL